MCACVRACVLCGRDDLDELKYSKNKVGVVAAPRGFQRS